MAIIAAWTSKHVIIVHGVAVGLLDPLVNALQMKRSPTVVARPDVMFTSDLVETDSAIILSPA